MREIIFDTETTGLDPASGHRLVELACVELANGVPTGRDFHRYVNPERDMPNEAFEVHGLSIDFLSEHPPFAVHVDALLEFIDGGRLVAHNAPFDLGFLNAELERCGRPLWPSERMLCTLQLARRRFPGAAASLDALCRRFNIDASERTAHGALIDARLTAKVYLELIGGRQHGLSLAAERISASINVQRVFREARPHMVDEAELAAHAAFLAKLKKPIWLTE